MESVPKSFKCWFASQLNVVASKSNGVLVQKGEAQIKQSAMRDLQAFLRSYKAKWTFLQDAISYFSFPCGTFPFSLLAWEEAAENRSSQLKKSLKVSIRNTNTLAQSAWNTVTTTKSLLLFSFVPFKGRRRHTCTFASYQSTAPGGHGAGFNFLDRRSN